MGINNFNYDAYISALQTVADIPEDLIREQAKYEDSLSEQTKRIESTTNTELRALEQIKKSAEQQFEEIAFTYKAIRSIPVHRPTPIANPLTLTDAMNAQNSIAHQIKLAFEQIKQESVKQRQQIVAAEAARQKRIAELKAAEEDDKRRQAEEAQRRKEEEYRRELERQNRGPLRKFIDFIMGT